VRASSTSRTGDFADITTASQAGWAVEPMTKRPWVTPSWLVSEPGVTAPRACASAAPAVGSFAEGPAAAIAGLEDLVIGEPPTVSRWPALSTAAVSPLPSTVWPPMRWRK
jgi:hypothetical protein